MESDRPRQRPAGGAGHRRARDEIRQDAEPDHFVLARAAGIHSDPEGVVAFEHEAELVLAQRAEDAALAALQKAPFLHDLPHQRQKAIERGIKRLSEDLVVDVDQSTGRKSARTRQEHDSAVAIRTITLDAARQEILNARNQPGTDPEIADRVLRRLDLRTVLHQK